MNIKSGELKAIRPLIQIEDKKEISSYTGRSIRTIEAVLYEERVNNDIEEQLFKVARRNVFKLSNLIDIVQDRNPKRD